MPSNLKLGETATGEFFAACNTSWFREWNYSESLASRLQTPRLIATLRQLMEMVVYLAVVLQVKTQV
jgi:hypothetical protein